jgi:PhnB protein
MTTYQPADRPTVVPRIFTKDVKGLVAFLKAAFGAKGRLVLDRPTELVIGDSVIMIADGGGMRKPTSSAFYVYVADADRAWARAVKAGAKSYSEPEDTPWGDRRAIVNDQWGNHWQIATHGGASGA